MANAAAGRNVILTGIPRSGTTLVCHLINRLPNCIALHEPIPVRTLNIGDHALATDVVARFFEATRASLLANGTSWSKHVDGRIPDRHVNDHPSFNGLRHDESSYGAISFDKPLAADFMLVLKHPSAFTAILPALHNRFVSFAVIRNPLAVLGSWFSVDMKFRDGHAPIAEQLDPMLADALHAAADRLERQTILLGWFFRRYKETLPAERILRYEDIVASGGGVLDAMTLQDSAPRAQLENENHSARYDRAWMKAAGERLLSRDGPYWHFYTREEVAELMSPGDKLA